MHDWMVAIRYDRFRCAADFSARLPGRIMIGRAFDDGIHPAKRVRMMKQARASLKVCIMPHCNGKPLRNLDGENLGICLGCALPIGEHFDRLGEQPKLTEAKLQRRLRQEARWRQEDEDRESRAMAPGWVYYVQVGERIKIGYAKDVAARLRAYPPGHKLLATHPGTKTLERDMHQQFRGSLAAGREWFYPHDDLLTHIDQVIAQFGKPGQRGLSRLAVGVKTDG